MRPSHLDPPPGSARERTSSANCSSPGTQGRRECTALIQPSPSAHRSLSSEKLLASRHGALPHLGPPHFQNRSRGLRLSANLPRDRRQGLVCDFEREVDILLRVLRAEERTFPRVRDAEQDVVSEAVNEPVPP